MEGGEAGRGPADGLAIAIGLIAQTVLQAREEDDHKRRSLALHCVSKYATEFELSCF
jgi:hypothetical protein